MVVEVALEVGGGMGAIAGAKFSFAGLVESYVVKATGLEYAGNVIGSHIALDGSDQGRLYLQGDFVENGWIRHGLLWPEEGHSSGKTTIYLPGSAASSRVSSITSRSISRL